MRRPPGLREPIPWGMVFLAVLSSAGVAAECRIDHRFASPRAETLIALPPVGPQAMVTPAGGLRFADGATLSATPTGPFAFSRKARPRQRLRAGGLPIVVTSRESGKLAMECLTFAAPSPPVACLQVVLRNKTAAAIQPVVRLQAHKAHGTLSGKHVGFVRDGGVFALCVLREGKGQVLGGLRPKRYVFRREGGKPLPNWGKPKVRCDRGFRNIVAGFSEPATYHLKAEPKKRYVVAVGLCESHWKTPGRRICDILIEGKRVATVDPVKPHGPDVPFVLTFPATDRDGNGWVSVTSVGHPGSPDMNSIVNVLWLFETDAVKGVSPADIVAGKANRLAACYVDCGGPVEAPGPATLDYRIDLPPKGSATLWLVRPFQATKRAGPLAALDPGKLLQATEAAWRAVLDRAASVQLSDPAPADLLSASAIHLLSLRTREGGRVAMCPGPFGAASADGAALAAVALDRMGLHAEAAEILADLVARCGHDALWHVGPDASVPTGQVLWALASHAELTGDAKWLAANYGAMIRAAEALTLACDRTKWATHSPALYDHGLIPPAAYRSLPADYWLVHDFWAWQGLRCVAQVARALGKPNDHKWLDDDLAAYTSVLRNAVTKGQIVGPAAGCLPAVPGEAAHWTFAACVAALYPTQALPADDKRVAATLRYLDQHSVEGLPGGLDGRSPVVDLPLACQYALARLVADDADAALAAFASVANAASPTGTLPEQANPRTRSAAGPAPSAAATAGLILLLRDMVVCERGDELHLCPAVPQAWVTKGTGIAKAPTAFGPVSYRATLAGGGTLVVEADIPTRRAPKAVVVHLPRPARPVRAARATVGQASVHGHAVRVTGWRGSGRIEIELAEAKGL